VSRQPGRAFDAAVAFLASDDSAFTTTSTFLVDGGIAAPYATPW
jgi:NAD(P)-dependent dehydrogenase (short-subunit alcohol dehydrogenase family)